MHDETKLMQNGPMTATRKGLLLIVGLILGATVTWALAIAYSSLLDTETGALAVPLAITVFGSLLLARQPNLRPLALGVVAGAALETAFFIWLFGQFRGLEGL